MSVRQTKVKIFGHNAQHHQRKQLIPIVKQGDDFDCFSAKDPETRHCVE